jgi:predicted dehydrogenase
MAETVRVGWLGAGLIATFHSKMLWASAADAVWMGVHDPDVGRAAAFANQSGATACETVEQVLDSCDAVYICTWTSTHLELVEAAAARGLGVFCEKPLGPDLSTARRLAEVVDQAGIVNQVGLILRRSPAFALARSLIHDADAGRVMSFVFRDDQFIPIRGSYGSTWRSDPALAGSGTLLEHSIHDVDVIEMLLGPVSEVSGNQANVHGIDGIEDVVSSILTLDSGAVGSLTSIWHDIDARPSLRRLEVFCERRHVVVEGDWYGPVRWTDATGETQEVEGAALLEAAATRGITDRNPDGDFVAAVRAGRAATPSVSDALRAHRVVDAIYRSCASGARTRPDLGH